MPGRNRTGEPLPAAITENGEHYALRVRYAETDQMRRAHHAAYFVWFEAARSEFCRIRGIDYRQMEADGLFLPIAEVKCRYLAPAQYDDDLDVYAYVIEVRRATARIGYVVTRGDTKLAEGETLSVLIGSDGRPRAFPKDLAARFLNTPQP